MGLIEPELLCGKQIRDVPPQSMLIDPRKSLNAIPELFSENITAKILRTATELLLNNNPPTKYPEVVPQVGSNTGKYETKNIDFWTCGFFPGCIYSLLERLNKYPSSMRSSTKNGEQLKALRERLETLGKAWSDPIHGEARLKNTHDLGFIMLPHMRPRWEMYQEQDALDTIITAASNLHTRFNTQVGAIRSWDEMVWSHAPHVQGMEENFIVIIDSMCNLELLYYAAAQSGRNYLSDAATSHARKLLNSHLRPEPTQRRQGYSGMLYSTFHMVVFSTQTGDIIEKRTCQGYVNTSTWSRGQAWAIMGYAQTYLWTGCPEFLDAACGLAEYFLHRLETAPLQVEVEVKEANGRKTGLKSGRYVPAWDFDAPMPNDGPPLRDTSAGTSAANGMLIIAEALMGHGKHDIAARYIEGANLIIRDTIAYSLASEVAEIKTGTDGELVGIDVIGGHTFDAVLKNATVSNNQQGYMQIVDHGLVFADYYLIEFGTRLLRLGLM